MKTTRGGQVRPAPLAPIAPTSPERPWWVPVANLLVFGARLAIALLIVRVLVGWLASMGVQ